MKCEHKIVIFDLDETLGYYTEFGMFWDSIKEYLKSIKSPLILNQDFFNKTLDLYKEAIKLNLQDKYNKNGIALIPVTNNYKLVDNEKYDHIYDSDSE